jgi:uncharacterized transporter YbjL
MKFYRIALFLAWFNKGYGITAPLKYLVALFGVSNAIATQNIILTMIVGIIYIIFCFILGAILYHIGFADAENEVTNRYNPLAKELRNKLKIRKVYK